MSDVVLSAGVRQNLLSLQQTAELMSQTQNRLATGKKVNSALDNPTNFFTSSALQARAGDFRALLDSMSNGIKTLQQADNGLTAITKTIESMQSTLRQARQDKSFKSESYVLDTATIGSATIKNLSFSGGAVGTTPVNVGLNNTSAATQPLLTAGAAFTPLDMTTGDEAYTFNVTLDGAAPVTVTLDTANNTGGGTTLDLAETIAGINAGLAATDVRVRDSLTTPGNLEFYIASGTHVGTTSSITVGTFGSSGTTPSATTAFGFGTGATDAGEAAGAGAGTPKTVDALVTEINANASLKDKIRASNDSGKLRIENLSLTALTVTGIGTDGEIDGTATTATVAGNEVRANFVKQFNEYIDQLNKLSDDASFNGINLLRGDKLKITFNENGTSTIVIQAQDINGNPIAINTSTLGILQAMNPEFDSDDSIDARLAILSDALGKLRTQASAFGSNLSIVQNRQDFTKAMINTLETGADNLVLADSNEEGANLLALQTRQQLSTTALSLSSQADQAILRLFG